MRDPALPRSKALPPLSKLRGWFSGSSLPVQAKGALEDVALFDQPGAPIGTLPVDAHLASEADLHAVFSGPYLGPALPERLETQPGPGQAGDRDHLAPPLVNRLEEELQALESFAAEMARC